MTESPADEPMPDDPRLKKHQEFIAGWSGEGGIPSGQVIMRVDGMVAGFHWGVLDGLMKFAKNAEEELDAAVDSGSEPRLEFQWRGRDTSEYVIHNGANQKGYIRFSDKRILRVEGEANLSFVGKVSFAGYQVPAEAAHVLAEWTEYHPEQTTDAEMQESGSDSPPAPPLPTDIEGLLGRHFAALKEGYDASLAKLVTIVLELKGTVEKLSAQNGELLVRLKGLEAKNPRTTTVSHGVTQTSPRPGREFGHPGAARTPAPTRNGNGGNAGSSTCCDEVETQTLRAHAGPSDALVSVRPTPGTRDALALSAPRDEAEAKEGWKKVERKKRRRPSGRTVAQSAGKSVPSWAQVAGDGAVCFNFYIGGGAGNTKPRTARRPQGGKKKEKGKGKEKEQRAPRV
ncbi:hypothetical protein FN846DRAFT_986427 [Sphaerosporella brunnea]|uniref:Uncharacterized protein n=1 Tax=Sphaerosporella brunnea TaxID=1250544 RepID=A0A5J5ET10_9PEZI|nr:hypothetical protein FN846DRAFT_986427 [Sphaerosporella brunnea]